MNYRTLRHFSLAMAVLGLVACAGTEPTVDTDNTEGMSYDGLYRVTGSATDAAWMHPDVDLSAYSKIVLQGVGITYRPGGVPGRFYDPNRDDHFVVTDDQKERFQALVRETFQKELAKSTRYKIVSEPGPDVLLIRGGLLDVVSYVPPDPIGTTDIYLSRVAEVTLVLEIRDSLSGAVIARAVDRRAAEDRARGFRKSNRVTNTAEVRRIILRWATLLRERLDSFDSLTN